MGLFSKLLRPYKPEKHFPPIPDWRPDTPIDIDRILSTAKYYTGDKRQLGVFKYGTVALLTTDVDDIEAESKLILNKIYNYHADFKPLTMDDENYLIEYSQPAFTIVFKDEIDTYWDYIEKNHLKGVCTDEVILNAQGQANRFNNIGKICLYGRSKMFMDAQDPQIVKVFNPLVSRG